MPGPVVTPAEWHAARLDLLVKEKELTRSLATLRSALRTFPVTALTKPYTLTGPSGPTTLPQLFSGKKQLIIYHFMLSPTDEAGCTGCSFLTDNLPSTLTHLHSRDTSLVLVSRAPIEKIEAFKKRMGWSFPWYSSFESDFNYDFQASLDGEIKKPVEYNYKPVDEGIKGERPGLSVFWKGDGGEVFHTYSSYGRGLDGLLVTYGLLDLTPLGRQEEGEGKKMDWLLHDEYDESEEKKE
ncbi:hypothetical protein G7Y89_g889 [Cudoniella acicularis]|uniref:DUF899-domain-containing protein n=1 Tax=Cudoniella acicularis TaxID=354080 RepID=A0A8H4RX59_9HELO|nr:hypothetical protein G7Y89_g889 [Cudoniella acicularis]